MIRSAKIIRADTAKPQVAAILVSAIHTIPALHGPAVRTLPVAHTKLYSTIRERRANHIFLAEFGLLGGINGMSATMKFAKSGGPPNRR